MVEKFSVIYADPPWAYNNSGYTHSAESHYGTLPTKQICLLPVKFIAAPDSVLFIWGTWPLLPDILQVINAWGFIYKTIGFVWVKTNKRESTEQFSFLPEDSFDEFFGIGGWTRSNTEFCLIATRGNIQPLSKDIRQVVYSPIQEHSRKPDEVRKRIVSLMGDLPRVELFAREVPAGWKVWGNEVSSDIELKFLRE